MAYGFQIRTNEGLTDVANINVARFISSYNRTNASGTVVENNFSFANNLGHIFISPNDTKITPDFTWNEGTKTLSYFRPTDQSGANMITSSQFSVNFTITFIMFD